MTNWKLGQPYKKNSNPNMLEGLPAISSFLGKSLETTRRWIRNEGLPATKLPNGTWLTHKGLVLQWIYCGHQAILKNRIASALEPEELALLAERMGVASEHVAKAMQEREDEQRTD